MFAMLTFYILILFVFNCYAQSPDNLKCKSTYTCGAFLKILSEADDAFKCIMKDINCGKFKTCCDNSDVFDNLSSSPSEIIKESLEPWVWSIEDITAPNSVIPLKPTTTAEPEKVDKTTRSTSTTESLPETTTSSNVIEKFTTPFNTPKTTTPTTTTAATTTTTAAATTTTSTAATTTTSTAATTTTTTDATTTTTSTQPPVIASRRPYPSRNICGYQHVDDRYYTLNITAIDEFPWLVRLNYNFTDGKRWWTGFACSGSLITRRYVLTTAHCAIHELATLINVRLGEYDRINQTDCAENRDFPECAEPTLDVNVEKVVIHENYTRPYSHFDIGLIRLANNIRFTEFIRPICLPSAGFKNATTGDVLSFTGFGFEKWAMSGAGARIKKRVKSTIVTNEECAKYYEDDDYNKIDETILCTRSLPNQAVCSGDSGSPGIYRDGLQWQQEAIVAFGKYCGRNNSASGNIRVSAYLDWIITHIEP